MMLLVTGATDGIGRATAASLAEKGHAVVVHGRDPAKVDRVVAELRAAPSTRIEGAVADLADLAAVRALGEELGQRYPDLSVVIHNAGVYCTKRELSRDGFELTLAVNHLAVFVLTGALLPRLRSATDPRVVVVASMVHQGAQLSLDDLQLDRGYDGHRAYARSKLCNVLFANALARREPGLGVNSLHPGVIATKLLREGWGGGGAPAEGGARTTVLVATDPALRGVSGRYFSNEREARPSAAASDPDLQERLWAATEALVGP
jgi:NAD(P)-dependent dehydrogenase (short-subunit alcohol dehydrogenase family)